MSATSWGEIIGLTFSQVIKQEDNERLTFVTADGVKYAMWHQQDCCESVSIDDIAGELNDLIGSPIIMAEESSENPGINENDTWSFFRFRTAKGDVTIRWYGSSNGYYCETPKYGKEPNL